MNMRKVGSILAFFSGLYGVLAAIVTLFVLGGIGDTASVDPMGVAIGWGGVALSILISVLSVISMLTEGQRPIALLLLTASAGFLISETLVAICMLAAFLSGLLAVSRSLPSASRRILIALPLARIRRSEKAEVEALPVPDHSAANCTPASVLAASAGTAAFVLERIES